MSAKCLTLQMIPNFATELENPDDMMEQQEDINKLVEWANGKFLQIGLLTMIHIGEKYVQCYFQITHHF